MPNPTIIVVEDEEELRENLVDLLEYKGYQTKAFSNGEDALEQYETLQPKLVLLDIQLPGIDGIHVLKEIKRRTPEVAVIMVSASSVRGVLDHAKRVGALKTILKPYSPDDILQAVAEAVGE